jgi:CRP-like cAMP-binding protein
MKPENDRVGTRGSLNTLSGPSGGILAMLRDLKPRFLEGLTPSEAESVLTAAKYHKAPANCVITSQDDPAKRLFLLLTGRARYFFVTEKGQKVILLWIPIGEIIGMAALLSPPVAYLTNTETVNRSSLLAWDQDTIRSLALRLPRLYENVLGLAFNYLAAYRAAHRALICGSARERLAQVLVDLASGIGHEVESGFELNIRNEELANEANVTLFTASRLLNEWQRAGILSKGRGTILLRNPERLLSHIT